MREYAWLVLVGVVLPAACTLADPARLPPGGAHGASAGADGGASASGGASEPTSTGAIDPPVIPADLFGALAPPPEAHAELCAPDDDHPDFPNDADALTRTFCQDLVPGGVMPTPRSLDELMRQLGLSFVDPNGGNGVGGNPGFAILGHSSALTARKVSSITPTVFVFPPPPPDGSKPVGYSILAFDPGETFVEVASHDPTGDSVNFYVVFFDKDCTSAPGGCQNADLLTQRLVSGWSNVRVYEDETSLGNTIFDCHVCHDPVSRDPKFLRMQEIGAPFTHWFSGETSGGRALLSDFHAAHGAVEDYGPIPAALVDKSDPALFAKFIQQAGFGDQPNAFSSTAIEAEIAQSAPGQPAANVPAGTSPTWQAEYEGAVAGRFIATPYHDVKVTDPAKLATMTAAYRSFLSGAASTLPDVRDVFLDDGLRDMGFAPKLGLDGRGLLVQTCEECHNANLDMTLTRERFLVDRLDAMSRAEKDVAIQRIQLPIDTVQRMPPPLFRTMNDAERTLMIEELRK